MDGIKRFVDIHSHIIFGADDGAESLDEAVAMLKLDRDEGAYAVFATPHYGSENNNFRPEASGVMRHFELIRERAAREVPEVELYLGTEWYCAWNLADRIRRREAFRMNETEYVLAEFLEYGDTHESAERIFNNLMEVKRHGFIPILAHPERYQAMKQDEERLRELAENGILLQVNAYDLYRNLNPVTKSLAQWLAKERLITFLGSDMHGTRPGARRPRMTEGLRWLYDNVDEAYADAVAFGNAEKLLGLKKEPGKE